MIIDFRAPILQNTFQWLLLKFTNFSLLLWNWCLKWNFYLTSLFSKAVLELAMNLYKLCSKLTMETPERHQLTSLQCLYCKLYTHFTTSLVFVTLTLNMKLFAGQLPSFCEDMWEICEIVPKSSWEYRALLTPVIIERLPHQLKLIIDRNIKDKIWDFTKLLCYKGRIEELIAHENCSITDGKGGKSYLFSNHHNKNPALESALVVNQRFKNNCVL